jgi:hypothetical protein
VACAQFEQKATSWKKEQAGGVRAARRALPFASIQLTSFCRASSCGWIIRCGRLSGPWQRERACVRCVLLLGRDHRRTARKRREAIAHVHVQPTDQPTNRPTDQPANLPTCQPTNRPTGQPTWLKAMTEPLHLQSTQNSPTLSVLPPPSPTDASMYSLMNWAPYLQQERQTRRKGGKCHVERAGNVIVEKRKMSCRINGNCRKGKCRREMSCRKGKWRRKEPGARRLSPVPSFMSDA